MISGRQLQARRDEKFYSTNFIPGLRPARPKEDMVVKRLLLSIFACFVVVFLAGLVSAQAQTGNQPPCDFSDQFYNDNGLDASSGAELNTEPEGRFGTFRQFGPPATQPNQANWTADSRCATNDPTRRNFRILATTGGNADDGNSPFSTGTNETPEFISILAFIHKSSAFIGSPGAPTQNYSRTVGTIGPNGGLANQQTNAGTTISIRAGTDFDSRSTGVNSRSQTIGTTNPQVGISTEEIVSNFEAYAALKQTVNGQLALNPCSLKMIQNLQNPKATSVPQPCFPVADTKDANGNTISDTATPNLTQDWRFATNRNAMDGSDNNCINLQDTHCKKGSKGVVSDSPFGYFCDDLLGMWIITYFWITKPLNDPTCGPIYQSIGAKNGFNLDGGPIILTAHELNDELEATGCGAEAHEQPDGSDGGAVWLVCPGIPDPTAGAIASDAFLDAVRLSNGSFQDPFISKTFTCLQTTGQFCP
jgi:hypothetical protein